MKDIKYDSPELLQSGVFIQEEIGLKGIILSLEK